MRTIVRAVAVGMLCAGTAWAADQAACPMHAAHTGRSAVDHRHQETTGLPSDGVEHHFLLDEHGGSIRLEVKDADRVEARTRVRAHLQEIARAFAAGDFSMPSRIHGRLPPGARTMTSRRASIAYAFAETPDGGSVTIATSDRVALGAIHEFLRFQIGDHETGDPIR
jgi:hypothetical protein